MAPAMSHVPAPRDRLSGALRREERPMARPVFLATMTTILLSLAVGLIAASVLVEPPPVLGQTAQHEAIVRQFYDAANLAIATGNLEDVRAIVAPHAVEHDVLQVPGMRSGRGGLEDYLSALHAINPDLRLEAATAVATDQHIMARVTIHDPRASALSGGAIVNHGNPWGPVDVFRVAGGTIVERWGYIAGTTLVRTLIAVPIDLPVPSPRVLTLERLHIDAGNQWLSLPAGPRLLYLEAGSLRVDVEAPALTEPGARSRGTVAGSAGAAATRGAPLATGQPLVVPSGAGVVTTNIGTDAARLLVVTFAIPRNPGGTLPAPEGPLPGVAAQILAGGLATNVPIGPAILALEYVALAPRASLSLSSAEGPALFALGSGRLDVTVWGRSWMRRGNDGASVATADALLEAGDGLQIHPDSLAMLDAAPEQPAVALVVTLRRASVSSPALSAT
jgi:hypothetical protein